MRDVFDQHTEMDHDGNVRGGTGKLYCLYKIELDKGIVRKLVKTPCRKIIEELRALFFDFYRFSEDSDSDSSTDEDLRVKAQEATKKLRSSEWILAMISRHLSSKWDVDDDGSLHKTSVRLRIEMKKWSQGTHSHSLTRSGTSLGSSSRSAMQWSSHVHT